MPTFTVIHAMVFRWITQTKHTADELSYMDNTTLLTMLKNAPDFSQTAREHGWLYDDLTEAENRELIEDQSISLLRWLEREKDRPTTTVSVKIY